MDKTVVCGFKAFRPDMTCKGKQYAPNTEYEEHGTKMCIPGMMHFCEDPIRVFNYYPCIDNSCEFTRFAEVEGSGNVLYSTLKDKVAATKLKIKNEIPFRTYIDLIIGLHNCDGDNVYINNDDDPPMPKYFTDIPRGQIISDSPSIAAHASGMESFIITSGSDRISTSADSCEVVSTGDYTDIAATGGHSRFVTLGYGATVATSGEWCYIATAGPETKICSTGRHTTIKMHSHNSSAVCLAPNCKIAGKKGDWITMADFEPHSGTIESVKTAQIDGEELKEDTFYVYANGKFWEVSL